MVAILPAVNIDAIVAGTYTLFSTGNDACSEYAWGMLKLTGSYRQIGVQYHQLTRFVDNIGFTIRTVMQSLNRIVL